MYVTNSITQFKTQVKLYFQLTKPRIVVLLSITGLVAFLLPQSPNPVQLQYLITFLLAGYFSAGGAMAINNAFDREMDSKMDRTKNRPSIHKLSMREVFIFGSGLFSIGLLVAFFVFGLYTTLYLAWGGIFYLLGYTLILKRNTWLNTIIGGLASPAPVWAAYAARAELDGFSYSNAILGIPIEAWLLGFLVFIWTPSHTWAMAVKNYHDYVNVDVPMLPVILGIKRTSKLNFIASLGVIIYALWLIKLVMTPIRVWIGFWISIPFIFAGIYFLKNPSEHGGKVHFHAHNIWLALIFVLFL